MLAVVILLVCIALYFLNPVKYALMPKCPMKLLTGFNCPGCGFQRALHAFLHGHFIEAATYNLFLLLVVPYLLCLVVSDFILRGEAQRRWQRVTHHRYVLWGYLALYFLWWGVRNVIHM